MKTTKLLSILALSLSLLAFKCEDEICDFIALADLTIPTLVDLFDTNGQPLIDSNTGQQVTASNELYYNHRTGEYFNADFPPVFGLEVGDVIEIATNIFNNYSQDNCTEGSTAAPTKTGPTLSVSGPFFEGTVPLQGMPTPSIPDNQRALTATAFTLATPGNYQVNFNANVDRTIDEHSYNNNYYYGNNATYSNSGRLSFIVEENKNNVSKKDINTNDFKSSIAPKHINNLKDLRIYNFFKSEAYINWYKNQLQNK